MEPPSDPPRQPHPPYLTRADISRDPRAPNNKSALTADMTDGDGLLFLAYLLTKLDGVCKCGAFQTGLTNEPATAQMPAVSMHLEEAEDPTDSDQEGD